jgi:hypothetical protein
MSWPPETLWPKIAALWATHGDPGAGTNSHAKAFVALKRIQNEFGLSDCQLAYVAEYQALDPSSSITKRERPENAFETALGIIDSMGLGMPFEYMVADAAWVLHTYVVFDHAQLLYTPRLLIHSRGSGYGKTARLSCLRELVENGLYMVAPTPAVLYHYLEKRPRTTFFIDDAEHSSLWNRQDVLTQIIDAGHRKGAPLPRVVNHEAVSYRTFAPLALGLIIERDRRDRFPEPIATRSIISEMKKHLEGLDQVLPDDPRFVPVRAVAARWAETFQPPPPKAVNLPGSFVGRCANNWRILAAIADVLGYGQTLRAAAVAIEAANFDPGIQLYRDIHSVFERLQADCLWTADLLQALSEIETGRWASLTTKKLYDLLYRKGIDYRTVWKTFTHGRRSNNGFHRGQFAAVWRELGIGHADAQSSEIIQLVTHKRHTQTHKGDTHE